MKKHVYYIAGVDCANCALKLNEAINNMEHIESASYNFANNKLVVYFDNQYYDELKFFIENFEKGIKLEKKKPVKYDFNASILLSIIISLIITVTTFFLDLEKGVEIAILTIAYIIAGYDVVFKLIKNLIKMKVLDENFLMGVATMAAFVIGEYYEAIAIIIFYKVGEFFQDLAVNRSRKSIGNLMDIQAEYANVVRGAKIVKIAPEDVKVGDLLIIKTGEKVPVDCTVTDGETYLDTSSLTGESKNIRVSIGDSVLSGSINTHAVIKVIVSKVYEDSTVAKILDLIENSSSNKAPTEDFITKFAKYYTPIVVLIAVLVAVIPPLIFSNEFFNEWVYRGLIFLVISCPCALVISIPLGFFGGIGNASKHGILIKGANYLEALNSVETIVFDKTGTLTKGNFIVTSVVSNSMSKDELIKITAHIESFSNHPIAKSILEAYGKSVESANVSKVEEIAGKGAVGYYLDRQVYVGNTELMKEAGVNVEDNGVASTVVHIVIEKEYAGYIKLADEVKSTSKEAIQLIKEVGVSKTIVLSGDADLIVKEVAYSLGVDEYHSKLLPHQKVEKFEKIENEKTKNKKIIFVGDGINDAPVLTRADIGIAMGGVGSDAAIESADIVIMDDDLCKIPLAIRISKKTKRIVLQNIVIALVVKLFVIILGLFGVAAIWQAVIADVGVALIAIFNAMRVLRYKGEKNGGWNMSWER